MITRGKSTATSGYTHK